MSFWNLVQSSELWAERRAAQKTKGRHRAVSMRASLLPNGGQVDPRDDNMLLVTTDGRKAALDLRLHNPRFPDHPDSKVNKAVVQVERIWRETACERSAQLVFCDLSIPTGGKGFSIYENMRDKLMAGGVPASQMAFIQDYDSDAAKLSALVRARSRSVALCTIDGPRGHQHRTSMRMEQSSQNLTLS